MPRDMTEIDMDLVKGCPFYAAKVRDRLGADLTRRERDFLDGSTVSGRETELLDCERAWTSYRAYDSEWTAAMQRYWSCLLTLHYDRAGRPSPIDPSANLTRSGSRRAGFYHQIIARGE